MPPRCKIVWVVLLAFVALGAIAALVLSAYYLRADGTRPEATVRAFFDGWMAHDSARILRAIDPDNRPNAREVETLFASSVRSFAEMKYEMVTQTNDRASVRVTGFVMYNLSGESGRVPIDTRIPLVRKNGRWYLQTMMSLR